MNLTEKLFEIQKAVSYLKKDNKGYQYQYVSSSQTLGGIRAKMDELGVMLVPRVRRYEYERSESENDKGKVSIQFFTEIEIEFTWINVESPNETMMIPWYAQGKDSGEKGVGKALTYGEKYFLLKFFHIATDQDDPDAYQQRRVEAGRKRTTDPEAPKQKPDPATVSNPYIGPVTSVSGPKEGDTDGRPWKLWEIETPELNLTTFDSGIVEVCEAAIKDKADVRIVWKFRNRKNGDRACIAEGISIEEDL